MSTNDDRAADGGTRPSPFDVDTAYPILTTPVRSGSGCATDPCGDLGKRARDAISDVLGWKFRADDPTAFLAALTSSFTLTKVEGHTEARWRPQGFAVQADLGAVTGAQASLAARARSAVAEATVLLDALVPLRVDFDAEVAEGFRALVRHDLDALRQELDSPLIRLPRVDQLFRLLLFQREHRQADDSAAPVIDPGTVRGISGCCGIPSACRQGRSARSMTSGCRRRSSRSSTGCGRCTRAGRTSAR